MSLSLYDLFMTMGPFAKFIVVLLAVMSLISWTSAFQKLWQIWRSQKETSKFAPEFSRFLEVFFFSSRRRHTRSLRDRSSDVCYSDLVGPGVVPGPGLTRRALSLHQRPG